MTKPLRIVVIDTMGWDYDPNTPLSRPLGGAQSAICFLCSELAALGHAVSIVNGTKFHKTIDGVHIVPAEPFPLNTIAAADVTVLTSGSSIDLIATLRSIVPRHALFMLWTPHKADEPAMRGLHDAAALGALDAILFVSRWQADTYKKTFAIKENQVEILRNAMSPAFRNLFTPSERILAAKNPDPLLAYTSTPFRGLDVLLDAMPLIRQALPKTRAKVFSGLDVYGMKKDDDPYLLLYQKCRETEGVDYIGNVSQPRLAQELKKAWCLAYPSIYPETSCISVMEAMAAGCRIVTTHFGALSETTQGYARMMPKLENRDKLIERYAEIVIEELGAMASGDSENEEERHAAVEYANQAFDWKTRAADFGDRLELLLKRRQDPAEIGKPSARLVPPPLALVHARHGNFLVNGNDLIGQVLSIYGDWAEPEVKILRSMIRPGDTIVDVGAHIGTVTVPLAKAAGLSGHVYAFEPQEALHRLLSANLTINGLWQDQVETFCCLAGDEKTSLSRPEIAYGLPGNFGAVGFAGVPQSARQVPMVRLDDVLATAPACRLIKIDVVGMEPRVIEGAMDLIRRCRPIIYCDASRKFVFDELLVLLHELDYSVQWHCFPGYSPANFFGFQQDLLSGQGDVNLICLPRESATRYDGPPAIAFDDVHVLFPGILPKQDVEPEPIVLPQPPKLAESIAGYRNTAEGNDAVFAEFARLSDEVYFLRTHRDFIESHNYGFGDRAFHAMWLELVRDLHDRFSDLRMLEIGVSKGQFISLWSLIGKMLGFGITIDAIATMKEEPAAPQDNTLAAIHRLFGTFVLDGTKGLRLMRGDATSLDALAAAQGPYHAVYIDSDRGFESVAADIANFAFRVVPGGYLIVADAAFDLPGSFPKGFESASNACRLIDESQFENVLNVGHNRIYRRKRV